MGLGPPGSPATGLGRVGRRPDVTLTQLRYFVAAAKHGSMTHAANEVRIAQSALSAAVAQLDRQHAEEPR